MKLFGVDPPSFAADGALILKLGLQLLLIAANLEADDNSRDLLRTARSAEACADASIGDEVSRSVALLLGHSRACWSQVVLSELDVVTM